MGNVLLEDLQREIDAGGVIAGVGVSVAAAAQTVSRAFAYTVVLIRTYTPSLDF
jgi:hypothetical protein